MEMNLENSIKDCIAKELEKGIVEKVIAKKLEECLSSSLSDMFGWNGKVKKVIEEKITSVMIPYLESYDYSEYIVKLDNVLVDVLKNSALENKSLLENFKELMISDEAPKEINMSEIYKKWCEYCEKEIDTDKIDGYDYEGGYINVGISAEDVSSSWSSFKRKMITFTCDEDEDLNVEFMVEKWESDDYYRLDWKQAKDLNSLRYLKKFEVFMMQLDQAYTRIKLDEEDSCDELYIEYEE